MFNLPQKSRFFLRFGWSFVLLGRLIYLGWATLLFCAPVQAQIGDSLGLSPFWDWKTIETAHFRLTFPQELAVTAQKTAQYFEEAHLRLVPQLKWEPVHKTQVLLVDNADAANGLTSPVGRFGILLYLTPPDNWFSTAYYDNWLRLLVFHEYTHLVNMDTATGIWEVARVLFGDVLLPNAAWPSWMLEGFAVYMETRFTHAGRGRSSFYEMLLRTAVNENVLNEPSFITLDKINGTNPYFPYGETAYSFGYQLMNQVARQEIGTQTADSSTLLKPGPKGHEGENLLGEMSLRSGHRIPFFINGNLENISGRDWYANWDLMVASAQKRAQTELQQIRSQPVSQTKPVIPTQALISAETSWNILGTAFSADGRWMAYSQDSSDHTNGLYLYDLKKAKVRRIDEKILGATLSFTPDSRHLIFSSLNRRGLYSLWSELYSYSLEQDNMDLLSDGLRARDPDVSPDGKWVTFTVTHDATTGLAIAPLNARGQKIKMGKAVTLFWPTSLDAVHTPKFSADGKQIYFSWHINGRVGENIAVFNRTNSQVTSLVSDGSYNRFPAVRVHGSAPDSELYFTSDRTGVDNVYRYQSGQAQMVTNTTTGMAFPSFDTQGKLYADLFSHLGWSVVQVQELPHLLASAATIAPPPAPPIEPETSAYAKSQIYPVEDYSLIPSIWPRQWLPVLLLQPHETLLGGQVSGFDATDRHRYILGAAYDTLVHATDVLALYSNRSFGINLTASVQTYTADVITASDGTLLFYSRKLRYTGDAQLPIQFTYSTLTPVISFDAERTFYKIPGANPSDNDTIGKSYWVPFTDARLLFSEGHNSRLAISNEEGRSTEIGGRTYFNSGATFFKALVQDSEYLRTDFLLSHSVLAPHVAWSAVNRGVSNGYFNTDVTLEGRQAGRLLNSLPGQSLDQLAIRGYPLQTYYARQAGVGSLDYRFPIAPIFRGWGTNPAFLENLHGFVFGETAYFPGGHLLKTLPSAGGGLVLDATLLNFIPLSASTEYHKGFRDDWGGKGELFFQINAASPLTF